MVQGGVPRCWTHRRAAPSWIVGQSLVENRLLPLSTVELRSVPLSTIEFRSVPLSTVELRFVPLSTIEYWFVPLGLIEVWLGPVEKRDVVGRDEYLGRKVLDLCLRVREQDGN